MKPASNTLKIQHLAWRAGFGANTAFLQHWQNKPFKKVLTHFLSSNTGYLVPLQVVDPGDYRANKQHKMMAPEAKPAMQKKEGEAIRDLNRAWLHEMYSTQSPFREKMALFWHGHFACRVNNALHNRQLLHVIRENALGNFGNLLTSVSKSPAMLQFLNNQQNRKQHPNENFAREVMELFTMGRGNYTEDDVKAGARAFTGWGYDASGNFKFRPSHHDDDSKVFLGKTGNFNGDDILKILLENKATAHHIAQKIYRYFVNERPDEAIVGQLADHFYDSGYDIAGLMEKIFSASWFYDEDNVGAIIKPPIVLLVGMQRNIPVTFDNDMAEMLFQRVMDQVLFYPPNVAGWPGGKSWIDSATLMFRMKLPQLIYFSESFDLQPKVMPEEMADKAMMKSNNAYTQRVANKLKATPDWTGFIKSFESIPRGELPGALTDVLLVNPPAGIHSKLLNNYADASDREKYIKTLSIDLMCTPEYQMC